MRIACPSCAVTYEVPDSRLKPGRKLRCARCNSEWAPVAARTPVPEPDSPPLDSPLEDERSPLRTQPTVSAMDLLAAHRKRQESPRSLRIAWIASIVVLVGLLVAGLVWRRGIMAGWPPSARLYGMVGLAGSPEAPPTAHGEPPAPHAEPPAARGEPPGSTAPGATPPGSTRPGSTSQGH
ncbi:MAG: zinc-ribbon domain-containing protein [Acetobacteraceae bacterium]|nr:zinc-ribbon domain-containing protein [Acetobacteraceae bacterium]